MLSGIPLSAELVGAAFLLEGALVRHFLILAALMLTACALPGASGTGTLMSSVHPTQEFCASHDLTLDATTKQCVTPPQPKTPPASASAESVTGSLPKAAQAQPQSQPAPSGPPSALAPSAPPPPQQRQGDVPSVPIEPGAVIYADFSQDFDLISELAHYVTASGYRCNSISALQPLPASRGFRLVCDRFNYKYAIEQKDGRTIVTVD